MISKNKVKPLYLFLICAIASAVLSIIGFSNSSLINYSLLPKFNVLINTFVFFILIAAFIAIKKRKIEIHKKLMWTAFGLSVLFLISYSIYHLNMPSTKFGGEGPIKTIYFIVLFSHIFLSIFIIPLVLITFHRALSEKFDRHKKIARITLPIWLYVTFTGIIVYFMISPYY